MSGTMAVTKALRSSDGTDVHSQRFISNSVPINAYSRCSRGGSESLPIVSRVSQVMLGDGEWLSMETDGTTSAFNLFEIPPCCVAMFVFEMAIPASIVGRNPEELVLVGCTISMVGRCRGYCASHSQTHRFVIAELDSTTEVLP